MRIGSEKAASIGAGVPGAPAPAYRRGLCLGAGWLDAVLGR